MIAANEAQNDCFHSYDPKKVNLSVVVIKSIILGFVLSSACTIICLNQSLNLNRKILKVCFFLVAVSVFHIMEFLSTAFWNPTQLDDDSFILNDPEIHLVYLFSLGEFFCFDFLYKYFAIDIRYVALFLIFAGQFIRTLSMYTASSSFNHYIQKVKQEKHQLVTWGIYKYLRHPSYFGYFWWFVGLQLWFGNSIILILGFYKLSTFFGARIEYEESLLIKFYGDDYLIYRQNTFIGFLLL